MSKPNYRLRNRNAIKRGFSRLSTYAKNTCEAVMVNVARDGLARLIQAHEISDQLFGHEHNWHLDETNTLGYALAHDGVIVESGYHDGGGWRGGALNMAKDAVSGTKGWVAVILADMQFGHYHYITTPHEEDMIHWVAEAVRDDWYGGINSVYIIPGSIPKPS